MADANQQAVTRDDVLGAALKAISDIQTTADRRKEEDAKAAAKIEKLQRLVEEVRTMPASAALDAQRNEDGRIDVTLAGRRFRIDKEGRIHDRGSASA